MTQLTWDNVGERRYETGVDRGVLYLPDETGAYDEGYAWNGLTTVTESPSGAESNPQYADNIKYLNLVSAEEFGATVEAYTYPDEFGQCDGTAEPQPGIYLGQQGRRSFGLSYRTQVGNDVDGTDHGYKLHLVYGALAAPSEKAFSTINDSPEAISFSWEVSTTPVQVTGYKPTALLTIDSTKVDPADLTALEDILYGTVGDDPAYAPSRRGHRPGRCGRDQRRPAPRGQPADVRSGHWRHHAAGRHGRAVEGQRCQPGARCPARHRCGSERRRRRDRPAGLQPAGRRRLDVRASVGRGTTHAVVTSR
jgi:hypothetical protein